MFFPFPPLGVGARLSGSSQAPWMCWKGCELSTRKKTLTVSTVEMYTSVYFFFHDRPLGFFAKIVFLCSCNVLWPAQHQYTWFTVGLIVQSEHVWRSQSVPVWSTGCSPASPPSWLFLGPGSLLGFTTTSTFPPSLPASVSNLNAFTDIWL